VKVTFIIGNGFDIKFGLNSKYIDVYDGYVKTSSANENLKKFKSMIASDYETWADFEIAMGRMASEFKTENDFRECITDFSKYLNDYLVNEENSVWAKYSLNECVIEFHKSKDGFYKGLRNNDRDYIDRLISNDIIEYSFICLNYTSILKRIVDSVFSSSGGMRTDLYMDDFVHIHGRLDEDLVLGVDNEQQINNYGFSLSERTKRAFIKPKLNESFDSGRVSRAEKCINESDIICVFGASLGDSDLTWRNKISNWLKSNANARLIIFDYKYTEKQGLLPSEKMDDEDDARLDFLELINEYAGESNELFNRIYFPIGHSIFNFKGRRAFEENKLPSSYIE